MQLENTFTIPVPLSAAWSMLLDIERIAPCVPGATLDSTDGEVFAGRVKVKLGAVQMVYRGEGKFVECDRAAGRIVLDVRGSELRGSGTVAAGVTATLIEDGRGTTVRVTTDLAVTGRAAQFGRGILSEVSGRIVEQFASNLAARLTEPADTTVRQAPQPDTTRSEPEALDLGAAAIPALARRAATPAAVLVLIALGAVLLRKLLKR
ncbi:SRPBCC family protein [Saccharopolyspora shandongensis]|uniref:SRPBCC family protein n=1 Tax=Saccharopolyspora shandongensis TaxID=418495 RepID=UPI0033FED9DE